MSFFARLSRWKAPLHLLTAGGATALLLALAIALAWNAYGNVREVLLSSVDEATARASADMLRQTTEVFQPPQQQVDFWVEHPIVRAGSLSERLDALPIVRALFNTRQFIDALFVAWPNGEFVLFRPLRSATVQQVFRAPEGATLLVQARSLGKDGRISGDFLFFDARGRLLQREAREDYVFDPRTRPWYLQAREQAGSVMTDAYVFYSTRAVGTTVAREAAGGLATVGIDLTLEALGAQTGQLRLTPGTRVAVVDDAGRLLASDAGIPQYEYSGSEPRLMSVEDSRVAPLILASQFFDTGVRREHQVVLGKDWELISIPVRVSAANQTLRVLVAVPHEDLFRSARKLLRQQLLVTLLLILLSIPAGFWLTQRIAAPLRRAIRDTQAAAAFDFSQGPVQQSHIAEVDLLTNATQQMKSTISRFLDVNAALNSETRLDSLLQTVLDDVAETVGARSGALYLFDPRQDTLQRSQQRRGNGAVADYPEVLSGEADPDHPAIRVMQARQTLTGQVAAAGGPELVAVPLETLGRDFVGALLLEMPGALARRADGARDPQLALIEALSSTAAVAIETRHLVDSQKQLLEAFIQLLAGAIDAKSPYTGGHCQRVPELTKMLVRAAHDSTDEIWRDFQLDDEGWEAIHVGAWLHDCGKITTPEHVVDKATKLESIHNRIHEIRTRFEVLKRDAEIQYWRARQEGAPEQAAWAALQEKWQALDADFAFVAECNIGGESLDADKIERLQGIAVRPWMRTLDDRLGLSREELRAVEHLPPRPLPAVEQLLADKPEHLVERLPGETPAREGGFRVTVPRYKFNRGELYNLSVRRGTLTEEERFIINDHIIQTIVMLERLPFPRHLRSVPEIAGGHHERMDGRGYPRGLRREEMSIPARIMAIADVFEALTAADRPYKPAKTLSESLAIMARMVREQHLDGELFALFLRSGVYRQYAERFLLPTQLDEVDIETLLDRANGHAPA